jgi:hypothetical protein
MVANMKNLKCISCGGEYSDICSDGLEYYHECAPVTLSETEFEELPDKRNENVGKLIAGKGTSLVAVIEEI